MFRLKNLGRVPFALLLLAIPCIGIELILQGADHGLWGTQRWRALTYQFGAFWPGLLVGWRPNFSAQPVAMFATYAFLHGGLLHLAVNMITLFSLGGATIAQVGQRRFLAIYVLSTLLGGVFFALLSHSGFRPMVGASGALFGLAGALVTWNIIHTLKSDPGIWIAAASILWPIGILVLLNVLMYVGTGGTVAWETHLGGFLGGAGLALFLRSPPARSDA